MSSNASRRHHQETCKPENIRREALAAMTTQFGTVQFFELYRKYDRRKKPTRRYIFIVSLVLSRQWVVHGCRNRLNPSMSVFREPRQLRQKRTYWSHAHYVPTSSPVHYFAAFLLLKEVLLFFRWSTSGATSTFRQPERNKTYLIRYLLEYNSVNFYKIESHRRKSMLFLFHVNYLFS